MRKKGEKGMFRVEAEVKLTGHKFILAKSQSEAECRAEELGYDDFEWGNAGIVVTDVSKSQAD